MDCLPRLLLLLLLLLLLPLCRFLQQHLLLQQRQQPLKNPFQGEGWCRPLSPFPPPPPPPNATRLIVPNLIDLGDVIVVVMVPVAVATTFLLTMMADMKNGFSMCFCFVSL